MKTEIDFDKLAETPTDLLTETTVKETDLSSITAHTTPAGKNQPQADNEFSGGFKNQQQPFSVPQQGQVLNLGNLVTPELQIKLINSIMPVTIVLLIERIDGRKVQKDYFELTRDDQNTMMPVLDACLKSINFNIDNPWTALIITAGFIYGTKTIECFNGLPPASKRKKFETVISGEKQRKRRPTGLKYNKYEK